MCGYHAVLNVCVATLATVVAAVPNGVSFPAGANFESAANTPGMTGGGVLRRDFEKLLAARGRFVFCLPTDGRRR